ncbi:MAG: cupin domain-containing protein [Candidatus Aenigmatarchaeota archaeon]|nr:cupin domain-containing protein [Nanoarchaeota archaeon]
MTNEWKDLKKFIEYPQEGILSKSVLKDSKTDVTLFCMHSESEMSEHISSKEGIVFVLDGKGVFNLEGQEIAMSPGVFIHMRKNARHSLKAEENMSFVLLLLKEVSD